VKGGSNETSPKTISASGRGRGRAAGSLAVRLGASLLLSSIGYVRAGNLRALAVTTTMRSPVLPDIPALSETLPGYEASAWYGIGAPKRTPEGVIERLNKQVNASLADANFQARLANLGATCCRARPPIWPS
jgi:tripartite-type tricarboxylate transporter receptor subunit TctC